MKGILQKKNESLLIFDILKIHVMKKTNGYPTTFKIMNGIRFINFRTYLLVYILFKKFLILIKIEKERNLFYIIIICGK